MCSRATLRCLVGRIWPAGRTLPRLGLYLTPGPASAMETDEETVVKLRSLYSQIPSCEKIRCQIQYHLMSSFIKQNLYVTITKGVNIMLLTLITLIKYYFKATGSTKILFESKIKLQNLLSLLKFKAN
jgi:hypothetical protein